MSPGTPNRVVTPAVTSASLPPAPARCGFGLRGGRGEGRPLGLDVVHGTLLVVGAARVRRRVGQGQDGVVAGSTCCQASAASSSAPSGRTASSNTAVGAWLPAGRPGPGTAAPRCLHVVVPGRGRLVQSGNQRGPVELERVLHGLELEALDVTVCGGQFGALYQRDGGGGRAVVGDRVRREDLVHQVGGQAQLLVARPLHQLEALGERHDALLGHRETDGVALVDPRLGHTLETGGDDDLAAVELLTQLVDRADQSAELPLLRRL